MLIPVLVVDSNMDDGEQVKKSLEANGQFQVIVATRAIEALMRFTETRFNVAVIDFGLPDLNGVDLIRQMLGIDEDTRIVAVLDAQETDRQELNKLSVDIILDKTTYLTDLNATLVKFLNLPPIPATPDLPPPDPVKVETPPIVEPETEAVQSEVHTESKIDEVEILPEERPAEPEADIPRWLKDPAQIQEYLLRLSKEHSAHAWLLAQGATPWIFSETITEKQSHALVRLLSEHAEGLQSKGALIRYIRLSGTDSDYLLYATPIIADITLTLIFSMETPFSVARRQAHKLSRLLAEEDPQSVSVPISAPIHDEAISPTLEDDEPLQPSEWIPASTVVETPPEPEVQPEPEPMLADIPAPDPIAAVPGMEEKPIEAAPTSSEMEILAQAEPSTSEMADVIVQEPVEAAPELVEEQVLEPLDPPAVDDEQAIEPLETPAVEEQEIIEPLATPPSFEQEIDLESEVEATITSTPEATPFPTDWLPKEPKPSSHLPFLDPLPEIEKKIIKPDPVDIALQEPKYFLPFTAILLPRFPNHKLVGSLANQLEIWLNDLCIAWGWRMASIDIRPEYLRFTLLLSPDAAPAHSVQSLAQNLSTRILQAFSAMSDDLPSGQFWTKSYLLTAGSDVGKDRLASFIETTRKEQGLTG